MQHIRILVEKGKYLDALPLLEKMLSVEPENGEALFLHALSIYLSGGDLNRSLDGFASAESAQFDPFRISLNRGIAFAENGDYNSAAANFERALAVQSGSEPARLYLEQTRRNASGTGSLSDLYYPPPHLPHLDAAWMETCSIPQSMQFLIDCLPVIRRLVASESGPLDVLDVGTATAAGPSLLATLYSGHFFGPKLRVDAIDLIRRYRMYARRAFPLVNYVCGDLFTFEPERRWDLVMCSHTIEHLDDPKPLIEHCCRRARRWALFYAPYEEQQLIPGHLGSIRREFVESLNPVEWEILSSPAWRHPTDPVSRTVLFVLQGHG